MGLFDDAPDYPSGGPATDTPPGDLACEHPGCGRPLYYAGRGRKPRFCDEHKTSSKSSSSSTASRGRVSDKDLENACSTLATLYDTVTIPVTLLNPIAGAVWVDQIEGLNERNRKILATNKDLVKKINSLGERGGNTAFAISHIVAITPVCLTIYGSIAAGRAAKPRKPKPQPTAPPFDFDGNSWETDSEHFDPNAEVFDLDAEVFRK